MHLPAISIIIALPSRSGISSATASASSALARQYAGSVNGISAHSRAGPLQRRDPLPGNGIAVFEARHCCREPNNNRPFSGGCEVLECLGFPLFRATEWSARPEDTAWVDGIIKQLEQPPNYFESTLPRLDRSRRALGLGRRKLPGQSAKRPFQSHLRAQRCWDARS